MVHITIDVPQGVKRDFKVACAKHGDNMSEILRERITDYISSKRVHIVKS